MIAKCLQNRFLVLSTILGLLVIGLVFGLFYFIADWKTSFVIAQESPDVIAVRIFPNREHLSPSKWYKEEVPNPGTPALIQFDGYEAVRDGRTLYVNGANVVNPGDSGCPTTGPKCIYTNIYMVSYSERSDASTEEIFSQLLANFELNINIDNLQVCRDINTYYCTKSMSICSSDADCDAEDDEDLCRLIYCESDLDCWDYEGRPYCGAKKEKLIRDTKRLADIEELVEIVDTYRLESGTGAVPDLSAGTYLREHSFSAWPSWQATLGNQLGTQLEVDPLDKFIGCRPSCCDTGHCSGAPLVECTSDDTCIQYGYGVCEYCPADVFCPAAKTCWDEEELIVACPQNAYVYGYRYNPDSGEGRFYYNVEYLDGEWRETDLKPAGSITEIIKSGICDSGDRQGQVCFNDNDCPGTGATCSVSLPCFSYHGSVADDFDLDTIPDAVDNCPAIENPTQVDTDADGYGDACDFCPDDIGNDPDGDGLCASEDNCPVAYNPGQEDADSDADPGDCDYSTGPPYQDFSGTFYCGGDACEKCIDLDGDGVSEESGCPPIDNCPGVHNPDQADSDFFNGFAIWQFNEGSGTTVYDRGPHALHGTLHQFEDWVAGKYGSTGLRFPGGTTVFSSVAVPDNSVFDQLTNEITLEAWVKPDNVMDINYIISKDGHPGRRDGFYLYLDDGRFVFGVNDKRVASTTTIAVGDGWHHVVGVYRPGGGISIFVDFLHNDEDHYGYSTDIIHNSNDLRIGRWAAVGGPSMFEGVIDEVAIYDRALHPWEIENHFLTARGHGDGIGDACDVCPYDPDNDVDEDGVCGNTDNCPVHYNPGQEDYDQDAGTGCVYDVNGDGWRNDPPPYKSGSSKCGGNACDENYCGNGIKEAGEDCDGLDGAGGGTSAIDQYHCLGCVQSGGYCGDGMIQYQYGEGCDCGPDEICHKDYDTDSPEIYIEGSGTSEEKQYMCIDNCKEWGGGWCGDLKIQDGDGDPPEDTVDFGEECEDFAGCSLCQCPDRDGDGFDDAACTGDLNGDCDDDPSDDPAICVSGCFTCDEDYECGACARCILPGAPEIWDDGIDNDCDGKTDMEDIEDYLTPLMKHGIYREPWGTLDPFNPEDLLQLLLSSLTIDTVYSTKDIYYGYADYTSLSEFDADCQFNWWAVSSMCMITGQYIDLCIPGKYILWCLPNSIFRAVDQGRISTQPHPGLVPLEIYYNADLEDHAYIAATDEEAIARMTGTDAHTDFFDVYNYTDSDPYYSSNTLGYIIPFNEDEGRCPEGTDPVLRYFAVMFTGFDYNADYAPMPIPADELLDLWTIITALLPDFFAPDIFDEMVFYTHLDTLVGLPYEMKYGFFSSAPGAGIYLMPGAGVWPDVIGCVWKNPCGIEGPPGDPTCADEKDNDCDGLEDLNDSDCIQSCDDLDGDGYGDPGHASCYRGAGFDCDDSSIETYPGALELCDGYDNNCDGITTSDESDIDGDGYLACSDWVSGHPHYDGGDDCDDTSAAAHPGATEGPVGDLTCSDGVDNDCDGVSDASDPDCIDACTDTDGDGYGNPGHASCTEGAERDCDNTDPLVYPGADELCDGKDNNCSAGIPVSEGDDDDDGYVECADWVGTDSAILGGDDCDDDDDLSYPGATERCDGNDNECLLSIPIDEFDDDGDGYVECDGWSDAQGDDPDVIGGGDCNDTDGDIHPPDSYESGADMCTDTFDNDCDTLVDTADDPSCSCWDVDGDGYLDEICGGDDCDDYDTSVSPEDVEGPLGHPTCTDGLDNDCSGLADGDDPSCILTPPEDPWIYTYGVVDYEVPDDGCEGCCAHVRFRDDADNEEGYRIHLRFKHEGSYYEMEQTIGPVSGSGSYVDIGFDLDAYCVVSSSFVQDDYTVTAFNAAGESSDTAGGGGPYDYHHCYTCGSL